MIVGESRGGSTRDYFYIVFVSFTYVTRHVISLPASFDLVYSLNMVLEMGQGELQLVAAQRTASTAYPRLTEQEQVRLM